MTQDRDTTSNLTRYGRALRALGEGRYSDWPGLADDLWPDSDNTLRAYQYSAGGVVGPHPTLSAALSTKAQASAALVGLDRVPSAAISPTPNDLRWLRRFETWRKANDALRRLNRNDSRELREQIVDTALATSGNLQARPGGQP